MPNLRSLLWLAPFTSFIFGYLLISLLRPQRTLPAPALVGKTLDQAAIILSQANLNLRVVGYKDDALLPQGTVVSQAPSVGTKVKEHQSLYLAIAKKPNPAAMPALIGLPQEKAVAAVEKFSSPKIYALASSTHPQGTIIAQSPQPGMPLAQPIILYVAGSPDRPVIMPNFKDTLIDEVLAFLQLHGITPAISHLNVTDPYHRCTACRIIDQRPLPGSFISINGTKQAQIQLQVG